MLSPPPSSVSRTRRNSEESSSDADATERGSSRGQQRWIAWSKPMPTRLVGAAERVRVAIIGTRGVPAAYGGFETFADRLSALLAARGHEVVVYCRRGRVGPGAPAPGVKQQFVPMLPSKYLETVSHTWTSVLHAATRRYDVILMVNA